MTSGRERSWRPMRKPTVRRPRSTYAPATDLLVDDRPPLAQLSARKCDTQVAVSGDSQPLCSGEEQADGRGAPPGSDDEVVLERPLVAVPDDVDARIDVVEANAAEGRNACPPAAPIAPEEVVDDARLPVCRARGCVLPRAEQPDAQRGRAPALSPAERKCRFVAA